MLMIKQIQKRSRRKMAAATAALLCAALTQTLSCSSFIVIHDTPFSKTTAADTLPVTPVTDTETAVPDTDVSETSVLQTEAAVETEPIDPEQAARDALAVLRDADLDGMNYLIATTDAAAGFGDRFDGEEAGSAVLPETRIRRTRMVEEKYNVRIISFSYEQEELYKQISTSHLSDDIQYVADFYAVPVSQVGRYQVGGMLFNLRSLPFTDFKRDYFDKKAMSAMSAGHGIWAAAGDYTFSPENYYAVYFNKELYKALSFADPYGTVSAGEWTWELLLSQAKAARTLLDRDGGNTYFGDNLAHLPIARAEEMILISSDEHAVSSGLDRTPTLSADTDTLDVLVKTVRTACINSASAPAKGDFTDAMPDSESMFLSGKMLYLCDEVANVKKWADKSVNWGILPLPKADTEQRNYKTYTGDAAVICVPSTVASPESTGTVLQALFAASAGTYPEVYLNEALAYYVRDGKSVDMLEIITNNAGYDFSVSFAPGYAYLNYATVYGFHYAVTNNTAFSSMYKKYKSTATGELTKAFGVR